LKVIAVIICCIVGGVGYSVGGIGCRVSISWRKGISCRKGIICWEGIICGILIFIWF